MIAVNQSSLFRIAMAVKYLEVVLLMLKGVISIEVEVLIRRLVNLRSWMAVPLNKPSLRANVKVSFENASVFHVVSLIRPRIHLISCMPLYLK